VGRKKKEKKKKGKQPTTAAFSIRAFTYLFTCSIISYAEAWCFNNEETLIESQLIRATDRQNV